ncbi:hypothetical protein A2704_00785 [Candidatus Kaiserbacteria bacterium RIFCSPHIGHO2_01_FULL_54_36b]|uniref:Coenzyme F420:L-glutamate ligase-like domain-containing protein n=1 Tax=Candidatus Kaiserbacteria bacterium RIFCSPHIGHO2_01_FULL_54_36b TaxID=1798483 RepID=A0A1F6CR34_9BACT|nr:MAG: hypothetical protein A2704_00785 [Candidatus Kaiserbacteria bacterium RIFCSPHIGHO2_01_FULL_54_36b]
MKVAPVRTRVFKESEDLVQFILKHVPRLKNGSVLAVTSKIVALSEGRTAIVSNDEEKERLIRAESERAVPTKYVMLTVKGGMAMANAGIDDSNGDGKLVLLPKDSYKVAEFLRSELCKHYGLKELGILITDSRVAPLRAGVVGIALGYAGFRGIHDYRGTPDIFGRTMKITQTNVADSLATAATVVMGEGREQQPLAVIEDAPVEFLDTITSGELHIDIEDDMYGPLFKTS